MNDESENQIIADTVEKTAAIKFEESFLQHTIETLYLYKKYTLFSLGGCFALVMLLIFFPQLIDRTTSHFFPSQKEYKSDPVIGEEFKVVKINATNAASLIKSNTIDYPLSIVSKAQLVKIVANPKQMMPASSGIDNRVMRVYTFLKSEGSPMAGSASTFVRVADQLGISWQLLPAIANEESGGGRVIPVKANGTPSYNPFGFGVTGDGSFITFNSWDGAIETVGKQLVSSYGITNMKPTLMESSYCPPSYNSDRHWSRAVTQFMNEM
jgi:hypothetical protein